MSVFNNLSPKCPEKRQAPVYLGGVSRQRETESETKMGNDPIIIILPLL